MTSTQDRPAGRTDVDRAFRDTSTYRSLGEQQLSPGEERFERRRRTAGLVLAPLLAIGYWLLPTGLDGDQHTLSAILLGVIVLWVTEPVPIPVGGFIGIAAIVVLGVAPADEALAPFGSSTVFTFIGAFILAESGLLDGQTATTTWWLGPMFRQRYPKVKLDDSRMVVASGDVVTAGAALSHMDLALWLVRQASPELATLAARYLIVDSRPSQSAYVLVDHLAHADPVVGRFERWARARLDQGFSLDEAAAEVGASKRTLARRKEAPARAAQNRPGPAILARYDDAELAAECARRKAPSIPAMVLAAE